MHIENQEKDLNLLKRIRIHQDAAAKEALIVKYVPMVKHIIHMQCYAYFNNEDLLQEGLIGLLKAIEEFAPDKYKVKFSTFAYICINRKVLNVMKYIQGNKQKVLNKAVSIYDNSHNADRMLFTNIRPGDTDPWELIEKSWVNQRLEQIIKIYLSHMEYEVIRRIIWGDTSSDIQKDLRLSAKCVDNARTRAKIKLKKILKKYGSFVNPAIPLKTKKRTDLAINLSL